MLVTSLQTGATEGITLSCKQIKEKRKRERERERVSENEDVKEERTSTILKRKKN